MTLDEIKKLVAYGESDRGSVQIPMLQAVLVVAVGWQIVISSMQSMLIPIVAIATAIIFRSDG